MTTFFVQLRVEILTVLLSVYILYKLFFVRKYSENLELFFHYAAGTALFVVANLFSSMVDEQIAFTTRTGGLVVNTFYMISLCLGAYSWFIYAENVIGSKWLGTFGREIIWGLPGIIFAVLCFVSWKTGWLFTVDESGIYHRGSLWFLQFVFCYAYMLLTIVKTVIYRIRFRDRDDKVNRALVLNTLIMLVGCILQIIYAHAYIAVCATIGIIISYGELCTEEEREIQEQIRLKELLEETKQQKEQLQVALDNYVQADYDRRTDFLTGLRNRQDMFDMLKDTLSGKRAAITSMYMLDIDNFKNLNDKYGHVYGDECLMRIGAALKEYGEKNDIWFYRYGGEEMIGIGCGPKEEVPEHGEQIVKMIQDLGIKRDDMPLGVVTVSLGYTITNSRYEKMIDFADKAMYTAKRSGKNRTASYEDEVLKQEAVSCKKPAD